MAQSSLRSDAEVVILPGVRVRVSQATGEEGPPDGEQREVSSSVQGTQSAKEASPTRSDCILGSAAFSFCNCFLPFFGIFSRYFGY